MYSFQDVVQFIFAGLTSGAIYAMVAIGFGVVHNIMGIVNFTQVDFVSLGLPGTPYASRGACRRSGG